MPGGRSSRKAATAGAVLRAGAAAVILSASAVPALRTGAAAKPFPATPGGCLLNRGPSVTVARILDGGMLLLADGREVRLAGALIPGFPGSGPRVPAIEAAARAALEALVAGHPVSLGFEEHQTDRYGRLLAHVFVAHGGGQTWLQGELLRRGLARAYGLPGLCGCLPELLAHEREARTAPAGLWRHPAFRVRSAADTAGLLRRQNGFEIVSGTVFAVAPVKGRLYINFGSDWRRDFTAGALLGRGAFTHETAADLAALTGRRVEVRGWIGYRGGPYMELWDPAQITPLSPPAEDALSVRSP